MQKNNINGNMEEITPITELSNELSLDIDILNSNEIIRMLRTIDAQIFSGYSSYPNIYDYISTIELIIKEVINVFKHNNDGIIVLSGCGTSGRIAFYISRLFNRLLKEKGLCEIVHYLISGHDPALLMSDELPEDDPIQGEKDLIELIENKKHVLYIGISCGLSAPYVAGQIDYCMRNDNITTILMGFNPVELSRDVPIELWQEKTFRLIALELQNRSKDPKLCNKNFLLTPIVGPEAITGSSRMKGGTVTKILLDTIFSCALYQYLYPDKETIDINECLMNFENVWFHTYQLIESIGDATNYCANALKNGRHIFYIGGDGDMMVQAFIDASEMPDTYGTPHEDVRAFMLNGWKTLGNKQGDLSHLDDLCRISLNDFTNFHMNTLQSNDVVVIVSQHNKISDHINNIIQQLIGKVKLVLFKTNQSMAEHKNNKLLPFDSIINLNLPEYNMFFENDNIYLTLATKWIFNALSTGANIQNGVVVRNQMINLTVANNKLYHRSIGIISQYAHVNKKEATKALLNAIYGTDYHNDKHALPISQHVRLATTVAKVIPTAILIASGKFAYEEARKALQAESNIRLLIQNA